MKHKISLCFWKNGVVLKRTVLELTDKVNLGQCSSPVGWLVGWLAWVCWLWFLVWVGLLGWLAGWFVLSFQYLIKRSCQDTLPTSDEKYSISNALCFCPSCVARSPTRFLSNSRRSLCALHKPSMRTWFASTVPRYVYVVCVFFMGFLIRMRLWRQTAAYMMILRFCGCWCIALRKQPSLWAKIPKVFSTVKRALDIR